MSTMCDTNNTSAPNMNSIEIKDIHKILNHFKNNTYRAADEDGLVRYIIYTIKYFKINNKINHYNICRVMKL